MQEIELKDLLDDLRTQIEEARDKGKTQNIGFDIVEAEVEIQGVASRQTDANGKTKVKFSVLGIGAEAEAGAGAKFAKSSMQKVRLKLEVFDRSNPDKPVPIHNRRSSPFGQ